MGTVAGGRDGRASPEGLPMDMSGLKFSNRIVSISFFATRDAFSQILPMSFSESMISLRGALGSSRRFLVTLAFPVASSPITCVAIMVAAPEIATMLPIEICRTMVRSFSLLLAMVISHVGRVLDVA